MLRRNGVTAPETLDALRAAGALADIDRHFAALLADWDADPNLALLAAVTSAAHRAGHTCLALRDCAGLGFAEFLDWLPPADAAGAALPPAVREARLPGLGAMLAVLAASPVVADADAATEAVAPLVLDEDRLYLRRLWLAERQLAERLRRLAGNGDERESLANLEAPLRRLFPDAGEARAAAELAASRRLAIVTGGPGTGKTRLAARLVALFLEAGLAGPRRIALATPTGKAAARLQESITAQLAELADVAPAVRGFAPNAITIHRLLRERSLRRVEALIVDECSMVDVALMARLTAALPAGARLILLGDAAQLASVSPGSVFSDLCAAGNSGAGPLAGCVATLTRSHRFRADGGIGRLAAAIAGGDSESALAALDDPADEETERRPLPTAAAFERLARDYAEHSWAPLLRELQASPDPPSAFPARRVLCAHRTGPFGANRFNRLVEQRLRQLVALPDDEFHPGRPIIVTRNDRDTNLANGDTGVVILAEDGSPQVWFPDLGRGAEDERFLIGPSRLPSHESFYALTIHRAQGSEYDEVVCVPGPATSRVNSRELLYTAVTRARQKVIVFADAACVRACVARQTRRASGLRPGLTSAEAAVLPGARAPADQ